MKNGEQPAFGHGDHKNGGSPGLTKREYIAAMILQGMFANPDATSKTITNGSNPVDVFPSQALTAADELLKRLEK